MEGRKEAEGERKRGREGGPRNEGTEGEGGREERREEGKEGGRESREESPNYPFV